MVLQQLKSGDKVKLQLIQPQFKCSGRDDVTCRYRGKVLEVLDDSYLIEFKYNKILRRELYYISGNLINGFLDEELNDIKIIK